MRCMQKIPGSFPCMPQVGLGKSTWRVTADQCTVGITVQLWKGTFLHSLRYHQRSPSPPIPASISSSSLSSKSSYVNISYRSNHFQKLLFPPQSHTHMYFGVLQVIRPHELFYRLPQIVLQESSNQLVFTRIQGAMDRGQAAVNGYIGDSMA